jgi:integrase
VQVLLGFLEYKYRPWVLAEPKTGNDTLQRIQYNFCDLLDRPLGELTHWMAEKWRAEQLKSGKSKATINRDMAALKAALSKAVEWGLIDSHPLAKLKPIKGDRLTKVRYLSKDEEARLREALTARDNKLKAGRASANQWRRARSYDLYPDLTNCTYADHLTPMVLLSLNTGLRRGEVFSLTWHCVNFQAKTLTVEGTTAKSGQTRHIPLNDEALSVLKAWRKQTQGEGLVFPGKDAKRLDNVRKSWAGVLNAAKIASFRWHDLRHDFASKLVMAGVPLNTVRDLLGHADLTTTLRYAHLAPDHRAQAVALLNKA